MIFCYFREIAIEECFCLLALVFLAIFQNCSLSYLPIKAILSS